MATTRPYLALIQNSVKDDGIYFEEIAPNYLYRAVRGEQSFLMHDVEVGLNNSAAAKLAMSKSGTYEVLRHSQIPAVEHIFLMNNFSRFSNSDAFSLAKDQFFQWGKCVVLKDDHGSQGSNVYKITTVEELEERLHELFRIQVHGAAISPYYETTYEYRIATLLGEPKIFLAKERTTSWKHNLIGGAKAKDVPTEKLPEIARLAKRTAKALELDFCTVDVLDTIRGLFVLEVNEQVMLDEYSKNDPKRQKQVSNLYREAILTRFKK